jgi:ParB family chromosome partitioning protein
MAKQALPGKRINAFAMDPLDVVIIGLDTKEDGPEHPLWDERIRLPIDEAMVLSVMAYGVKEPILVRKDGDVPQVVDGRRRVLHAREANRRLKKAGEPLVMVPTLVERGADEVVEQVSVALNEIRVNDTVTTKAAKAVRMLARNPDMSAASVAFGVSVQTIRNWVKLTELAKPVRSAVDSGKISPSAAVKLHGFSRAEQEEELEKLLSNGKATTAAAGRAAKRRQSNEDVLVAPGRRVIRKVIEVAEETELDPEFVRGIRWAIGELDPAAVKGLKGILNEL